MCSGSTRRPACSTCSSMRPSSPRRAPAEADLSANASGIGRELFTAFRRNVGPAETGAAVVV